MTGKHQLSLIPGAEEAPQDAGERPLPRWGPDWRRVRLADLPEPIRELAELIGIEGVLRLLKWRGGTILSVPQRPGPRHPISEKLGPLAAAQLAERCGGNKLNLPTLHAAVRPLRDRAIRAEFDAGRPINDLVQRFGLGQRRIREILSVP